ncbi:MAG: hypothetical protein BGN86_13025 [Caulobacterales bacterium 68-7]|nr:MAG: hypothetical protein BGN86_13025 [Caulobacterales bacterium 68-7]
MQSAVLEADPAADLLVSAQTGSGKTVAYGLGFAATLLGDSETFERAAAPLALVVAPTRELALQVFAELKWLYAETGARLASCVGGMDPRAERRALENGAHIVVGTPGRLRDHIERGAFDTSALRVVVLDEADEMLDLGFREDLEFILDASPAERRTLLFSATIAREIATMAKRYQRDALRIDPLVRNEPHGDIEYRAMVVAPNEIEHATVNVLRLFEARAAIVFCATREAVRHLHASLTERGFSAVALSGELSQNERSRALQALRDGRSRVCVATDVAARGLDLPDLSLVIHADLPQNSATLLHRSGRTGRAGRKGVSVLLVGFNRRRKAEMLISGARVDVAWSGPPTTEDIRQRDVARLLEDPILATEPSAADAAMAEALLQGRTAEQLAAAFAHLYRKNLPEPEDLFDGGREVFQPRERREREPYDRNAERGERPPRGEKPRRDGVEGAVWFRINVGREKNADPKWLIPLICRQGHVTKADIGLIKIFDRDTRFEILPEAAARFGEHVAVPPVEGGLKITPADAPFAKGPPRDRDSDQGDRPAKKPFGKKPFPKKDFGSKDGPKKDFAPKDFGSKDGPKKDFGKKPFAKKPFAKKDGPPGAGPKGPKKKFKAG